MEYKIEEIIEKKWKKSILNEVIEYCSSNTFKRQLKQFQRKYYNNFEEYLEISNYKEIEHSLELYEIFKEYQELIEELLEDFIVSNDSTVIDFYKECQSSLNNEFTVLFEEHEHKWFVDALLAWLDYDCFFNEMILAVKASHTK